MEHPVAQLALDRGDGRGEEPLRGEPVREPLRSGAPRKTEVKPLLPLLAE